jgi:sec-independent protein translocase protein TatA
MFNIGPLELMVILLLALVVVGPSRLPEVGRSIGKGLRELRKVQDEVRDSINFNLDAEPGPPRPAPTPRTPRRGAVATTDDEGATPATPIEPELPAAGETSGRDPTTGTAEDATEALRPADPPATSPNGSTPVEPPQE